MFPNAAADYTAMLSFIAGAVGVLIVLPIGYSLLGWARRRTRLRFDLRVAPYLLRNIVLKIGERQHARRKVA